MIRVAVINFKNLIRNLIKFIIMILLFLGIRNIINLTTQTVSNFDYKSILNKNVFFKLAETGYKKEFDDILDIAFFTSAKQQTYSLNTEVGNFEVTNTENINEFSETEMNIKNTIEENTEENKEENQNNIDIEKYKTSYSAVSTSVVVENNISENYNTTYDTVKIKNESKHILTTEMLTPNISFSNKKDILIFHTHTCESYTPTEQYSYVASGNFRTIDMNYSVARVGTELTNYLTSKNFNVTHLMDMHDYPAYNGSYTRSYNTVSNSLKSNPSTQLVIDLHRDAVGSKSNYAPSVMIGEERVAQLMFVIGTNGGGLSHNNWNTNLKLAIKIQQKANEIYPGLFRPIIVRNSRYNQNLADRSVYNRGWSNRKYS